MKFAFDLISDLHLESWPDLNLDMIATSPLCIVAGDVGRDRAKVVEFLEELSNHYTAVFYIDGNDEHRYFYNDLGDSYRDLDEQLDQIRDLVYLQNNVVVVDGVAVVAVNGWWDYLFDPVGGDEEQSVQWMADRYQIPLESAINLRALSISDARYATNTVQKLQTHQDVKKIVMVSHTVPLRELVDHDIHLTESHGFNCIGNSLLESVFLVDTEKKIDTWCFGHYHGSIDREINGVRYVNNCRGKNGDPWCNPVYYPKRIEIDLNF